MTHRPGTTTPRMRQPHASDEPKGIGEVVEVGSVKVAWGDAAQWKAQWRGESARRHLELPLDERLRSALALVIQRTDSGRRPA
jgi:hypothetical protein